MPEPPNGSTTSRTNQQPPDAVQVAEEQQTAMIIAAGDFCFSVFVREGGRGTAGRFAISFHGITSFYCVFPIRRGGATNLQQYLCFVKDVGILKDVNNDISLLYLQASQVLVSLNKV